MKKNEQKKEVNEQKKERAKRKFFLYAEGKGLVATKPGTGEPTFNDGELVWFNSRSKAMFARDFFVKMAVAEHIDILAKVA